MRVPEGYHFPRCLFEAPPNSPKLAPPLSPMKPHASALVFLLSSIFSLHSWIGARAESPSTIKKPNIIFLLADDLAANAVGYSGNKDVLTPHIDRLAHDGIRFRNHYDTTSICMASRCTLLTGLYEYRHGCNFDHGNLERRFLENSYPVLLRNEGYFTGFAGKIGFNLESEKFDTLSGFFDVWAGGPGQTFYETVKNAGITNYASQYPHCSRAYGAWASDFLKSAKDNGKPFCMSISFKAPHMPYTPDPQDLALYQAKTFTRPPNYGRENRRHLSSQSHTSRAATHYQEWVTSFDETASKYYALITGIDAAIGMIRDELKRLGLEQNTIIILTSDNGYNAGSHGFGDKVLPYEEASKAPLLIYDPRLSADQQGKASAALTGNIDIAPTILAFAGIQPPSDVNGMSLIPLLSNPNHHVREFLPLFNFWGIPSAQSMAIVTPEWKYIYWFYGGDGMQPTDELFQLTTDRIEMHNVIANEKYSAPLKDLQRAYDQELQKIGPSLKPNLGYEPYSILFNRQTSWEQKAPLISKIKRIEAETTSPNREKIKRQSSEPVR